MPWLPARDRRSLVLIIVYTGSGKGKTSACVGQALRALGQGFEVAFAQFIKRPDVAGEQKMLARLLGANFRAGGLGFCHGQEGRAEHRQAAFCLLQWAAGSSARMLVLDEAIYALNYGLIAKDELEPILTGFEGDFRHAVLSGRGAPDWLKRMASIVTEMRCEKHACEQGIKAAPGIEY